MGFRPPFDDPGRIQLDPREWDGTFNQQEPRVGFPTPLNPHPPEGWVGQPTPTNPYLGPPDVTPNPFRPGGGDPNNGFLGPPDQQPGYQWTSAPGNEPNHYWQSDPSPYPMGRVDSAPDFNPSAPIGRDFHSDPVMGREFNGDPNPQPSIWHGGDPNPAPQFGFGGGQRRYRPPQHAFGTNFGNQGGQNALTFEQILKGYPYNTNWGGRRY